MINRLLIAVCTFICLHSCKKSEVTTRDLGYNHYPSTVGDYKVYELDCLVFNDFTLVTDTYHFYYKDLTESEFIDAGNRNVKRIERYRSSDLSNWKIQKVWTSHKTNLKVEEQMDNIRLVKLNFPIEAGKTWDGNATNTNKLEAFEYSGNAIDSTINGINTAGLQKVTHFYRVDPLQINTEISFEHYAQNIGMVNKYEKFVKRFTTGVPGDPIIDSGYVLSMRIKSFEIE